MVNLDEQIRKWRGQMAADGVSASAVLDELESHLRDDMEQRIKSGLNPQDAFAEAARQIGPAHALRTELQKINRAKSFREWVGRKLAVIVAIVGLICMAAGAFRYWVVFKL